MNTLVIRALAKINLALDVLGKREDGYHNIDMVTIPLKLHDSIEISRIPGETQDTYLYCDDPSIVCDESNLAYKALDVMKKHCSDTGRFKIFIYKKIPVEAGLGGGSADAAAIFRAFEPAFPKSASSKEEINKLALSVGADVPYCFRNLPSRVGGVGEVLSPISVKTLYYVLIVKPPYGLSTKSVYQAYDLVDPATVRHPDIAQLIEGLKKGDESLIEKNLVNVLAIPAIKALPLIQKILDQMKEMGLPLCGMSGSGSACFALSTDKKLLEHALHNFSKDGNLAYLTQFATDWVK
ncbi:MAG: 4-(cytidine 5'-diphospho)-2-C-methyl-D-erythritol kinase [Bacilli bacterium]